MSSLINIKLTVCVYNYICTIHLYYNNMNYIRFEDPLTTDNAESVLWHNMKICDDMHNLQLFISCSMGWLELNPTKNMQNFESELRERDFNTHLCAKNIPTDSQYTLKLKSKKCNYECIFCCKPKKLALEEVLEFNETYESNFEKLENSGFRCLQSEKDILEIEDTNLKICDDKDKSISQLLTECKKKIVVVTISAEKYIRDICQNCKETYGREPEHKIVAVSHEGGPIIGLFLDGELVNQYGYVIEYSRDGESIGKHMRLQKLC